MPDRFDPTPKQLQFITSTAPVCIWQPAAGERGTGGTTALIGAILREEMSNADGWSAMVITPPETVRSVLEMASTIRESLGIQYSVRSALSCLVSATDGWDSSILSLREDAARHPDSPFAWILEHPRTIYLDNPTPALIAAMREAGVWAPRVRAVVPAGSDVQWTDMIPTMGEIPSSADAGDTFARVIPATRADNPHVSEAPAPAKPPEGADANDHDWRGHDGGALYCFTCGIDDSEAHEAGTFWACQGDAEQRPPEDAGKPDTITVPLPAHLGEGPDVTLTRTKPVGDPRSAVLSGNSIPGMNGVWWVVEDGGAGDE